MDEAIVLAAVQRGAPEALALLYGRFRPLVFSAAFRITGDANVAEDVVQETFLQVREALPRWRPQARLSTWIYRIAVNEALDEKRRSRRRPVPESGCAEPIPERAAAPSDPGVSDRIHDAVAQLPAREKAVFVLRHYEGMALAEIAEVLDVALGTVKATLHHALSKLADRLRDLR
ncbi:MAG: RNA polymerase sigma factor [Planctomycetes bacterium]|nr:RNA polymerase sigma factor [Planctomycetota bacterium]